MPSRDCSKIGRKPSPATSQHKQPPSPPSPPLQPAQPASSAPYLRRSGRIRERDEERRRRLAKPPSAPLLQPVSPPSPSPSPLRRSLRIYKREEEQRRRRVDPSSTPFLLLHSSSILQPMPRRHRVILPPHIQKRLVEAALQSGLLGCIRSEEGTSLGEASSSTSSEVNGESEKKRQL